MSDDDFKKTSEVNPPLEKREELIVKASKAKLLQRTKSLSKESEKELTVAEQNAVNRWNNDIKPILKSLTSAQLEGMRGEIRGLPDNMRSSAESYLSSAIDSAVRREDALRAQNDQDKLAAQMEARAKELEKLWDEFKSKEFQDRLNKYADEDKKSLKRIDELLKDPSKMTEDEKRRARGEYTDREREELEERRRTREKVAKLYKEASEQAHYHGYMAEKATTDEEKQRHKAEKNKYGAIVEEVAPIIKRKQHNFENLEKRAEENPGKSEVLKDDVYKHYEANKKEYHEEIKNHKNPNETPIVKLLAKAGLQNELDELQKDLKIDLSSKIKEAKQINIEQEKQIGKSGVTPPLPENTPPPPSAQANSVVESNKISPAATPRKAKFNNSSKETMR